MASKLNRNLMPEPFLKQTELAKTINIKRVVCFFAG
jgi:hypothetical protein